MLATFNIYPPSKNKKPSPITQSYLVKIAHDVEKLVSKCFLCGGTGGCFSKSI